MTLICATQTAPNGTSNYSYDANNRLISAGGVNYSYDANGNLTSTTAGQSFAWDVFNRMTSATGAGGTATYTYNGDGLKTRRIGPDGTTRYYYDGIRPIWEGDGAGAMKAQLDRDIFGNLLSRKEPAGTRRYYHFDGLGSTTALSDEAGAAVASLLYDAWGNQRAATGATVPNYRFTGAELDTASGLYHMGARFYDPTIGRWLSEDPARGQFEPLSLNLYSYVLNNPTILVDPSGMEDEGPSGGLTAEERLAAFINAMIDLELLIDYMMSHGLSSISIGGVQISVNDMRLAVTLLSRALGPSTPSVRNPTRNQVFDMYRLGTSMVAAGTLLVALGGYLILEGFPGGGAGLIAAGTFLIEQGGYSIFEAAIQDRRYYIGTVFNELNRADQLIVWIVLGFRRP